MHAQRLGSAVNNTLQAVRYTPQAPRASTILLLGTDADGYRTDVIMLATVKDGIPHLVSLPRDTLIQTVNGIEKLNAVYAVHGGNEDGIAALRSVLQDQLGVQVRNYVLADLSAFEMLVDEIGGIWYDVPAEMHYADPAQDLQIDLSPGYQKLNGMQALGLVRYRNYFLGDIERTKVQQSFLQATIKQIFSDLSPNMMLQLCRIAAEHLRTDMKLSEMINLAFTLMKCDYGHLVCDTLPGDGTMINGVDYYCLDYEKTKRVLAPFQNERG